MRENLLNDDMRIDLIKSAIKASQNAYAPFSNFKVGAALLAENGEVFLGCNIENSSYGATICAERTALVKAVSDGTRSFSAIAVVSDKNQMTYPCGICRQFMFEFMPDAEVIVSDLAFNFKTYKVSELIPHGFRLED